MTVQTGLRRKLGALIGGSWFGAGFEAGMGNRRLKGFQASRAHLNSLIAAAGLVMLFQG